jgi:uncharacterized protein YjiS (DUF1127 family)
MSAIISINAWPTVTKSANGLARLVNAGLDRTAHYFACRAAITTLGGLDDRALRDIGLARSQIEAAVGGFMAARDPAKDMMPASSATLRAPIDARAGERRPASAMEAVSWS